MSGFGKTIKQVNKLKIKLGIDGLFRVYIQTKGERTCLDEFGSLTQAIEYAKSYKW